MTVRVWWRRWLARIEAATSGYLVQIGWVETRAARRAMDRLGAPTPWFTYPAIRFLSDRCNPDWRVLEFGAGMGTLWWSARVREVVAVEHDAAWAEQVRAGSNARVLQTSDSNAAAYMGATLDGRFDVVIIDGLYRNECLATAPDLLADDGVIILDDAQRQEYEPGVRRLRELGFRVLELHGPQPVSKHPGCTSILYRNDNTLGL